MDTIWNILGISEDASIEEIREAYAKKIKACHPEEKPEEFAELQKVYKVALKQKKGKKQIKDDEIEAEIAKLREKNVPGDDDQEIPLMDILEERLYEEAANSPAMKHFKTIFMNEEKRQNRTEWRSFFLSETFLDEQYEETFVKAMHEFLKQQDVVPYTSLPDGLVIELAIVYVLRPKRDDFLVAIEEYGSGLYDWKNVSVFQEVVADIWNSQENFQSNYKELESDASFIRRKSYDEYRTMRDVVLNNTWEYKSSNDDMEEYKYTLSMAHWEFLADDDKVNSMDIDDIRVEDDITHACEVELYDYLLRKYGFPVEACSYMYHYFGLEDIEKTEFADVYKNLKAHILELYPDMDDYYKSNISPKDYADDLADSLKELQEKYAYAGWGKNFKNLYRPCYATEYIEWCEEEAQQVYQIVNSVLFQKFKFEDCVISKLIISEFSITQAKIFYEIYNDPQKCFENSQMMRLLHELFSRMNLYGRQERYLNTKEYEYDLSIGNCDFWEYFLSVAFADRFMKSSRNDAPIPSGSLYYSNMTLPTYMRWTYMPSVEWRLCFTNYDKETGNFGKTKSMSFKLRDDFTVYIEFHYHYLRYYINDKEVLKPALDVNQLFDYAEENPVQFMLLLPITYITEQERQRVFDRLVEILDSFVKFPVSSVFIATMITNDNASIYELENIVSRDYIENLTDCYRLDKDNEGTQKLYHFHPKYGCWEYFGEEMIGQHFRNTLFGEPDDEGYDMESFQKSDLSLSYEVETAVHDCSGLKTKEKIENLLQIFRDRNHGGGEETHFLKDNKVIFVFGDKNRIELRQHFATGVILNAQMEKEAYQEHEYLEMYMKNLVKYAKEELQWKGWVGLENYSDAIPVAMGASGSCYAFGVTYGKGMKAKDFAVLLDKMMCLDDLTQIIEYEVQNRSEWECGAADNCFHTKKKER